jgi:hypothetical protein
MEVMVKLESVEQNFEWREMKDHDALNTCAISELAWRLKFAIFEI